MNELFMMQFFGDLPIKNPACKNPLAFYTLEDAINKIHEMFPTIEQPPDIAEDLGLPSLDPEDDRIVIWCIDPGVTPAVRVVWHFSGWHWQTDAADLPGGPIDQGALNGYTKTVYEMVTEEL